MWCTGTQPAPPVPALSLAWPGPGSVSQGGTPASPPRHSSLLPCPGVGTFAKQSPPWAFLVGLTGLSKALCAELLPVTPAGRIALSGSYFKADHHPRAYPYCESWCVASRVAWDDLCPNTIVSRTGLESQTPSGPGLRSGGLQSAQERAPRTQTLCSRSRDHSLTPSPPAALLNAQHGLKGQADLNEILALESGSLSLCLIMGVTIPASQDYHEDLKGARPLTWLALFPSLPPPLLAGPP